MAVIGPIGMNVVSAAGQCRLERNEGRGSEHPGAVERSGERLERVLLHAHAVDVGDGGKRRGNSLPREGLQPCVAPYFATRGRGDMRGERGGIPPKSPPRRWCEAVASTMVLRATCCVSRGWLIVSCGAMTACHRLRGGNLGCPSVVPACRRHPGRRNTGLRTAAIPSGD